MSTDFILANHGSISLLLPVTDKAQQWADEHLPEDRPMFGAKSIVIEHRYVGDILVGILNDGLNVDSH